MIQDIIDYQPMNEQEQKDKALILTFRDLDRLLSRDYPVAHFTSSGLIMNKTLDKVLFVYHNIYQAWCWSGGHNDGDEDFLAVALKEAQEETGLKQVVPLSLSPLALDVIPVFGHLKHQHYVSSHLHLNVTYVLIADEHQQLQAKLDENSAVKWFKVADLNEHMGVEKELLPIYLKIIERARGLKNEAI